MSTIDEEVEDISIEKDSRSNDNNFNKVMELIKKFPLKNPMKIIYSKPSEWIIPKSYTFPSGMLN